MLATFVVNDFGDGINPGSATTLREAIIAANNNPGHDLIRFSGIQVGPTGGPVIQSEMLITDDLTIDGAYTLGQGVTLRELDAGGGATSSPGDGSRIFRIENANRQINVTLENLIMRGADSGATGGAILNFENLSVVDSTITGNLAGDRGGGIANFYGTTSISNSVVSDNSAGNGGAIFNQYFLNVSGSTIAGNTASEGGGIRNNATATITNSTLSGNSTSGNGRGGGIHNLGNLTVIGSTLSGNSGYGGGIHNSDATVQIRSSTFSGNSSPVFGGGLRSVGYAASVSISNSTFTNNSADRGGGVDAVNAVLAMDNTIVAGNTANTNNDITTSGPAVGSYNLIGDGVGLIGLVNGVGGNQGNQVGTVTIGGVIDPLLGPLANNGGLTLTHALLAGSPAIDAGSSAEPLDQRGAPFLRDDGNGVDIGAYEGQSIALVVDTNTDIVDGDYTAGNLSLREAIGLSNANAGPDTITFDAAVFTGGLANEILLGGTQLEITETLMIDASLLSENVTIDAQQASRVLRFSATTGDLTLGGLDIQNGYTYTTGFRGGSGVRFDSDGTLSLTDSTVSGNTAGLYLNGGGIFARLGSVTLTGSSVSDNTTDAGSGGGIYSYKFNVTLTDSTVSGNTSGGNGGGIYGRNGGGIYTGNGSLSLTSSTVSGNTSGRYGGGIYASFATVTLTDSTVSGNSGVEGGGIFIADDFAMLTDSTVSDNTSAGFGGGIYNSGSLTIINSTLSGNSAGSSRGGGIANTGPLTVIGSTLSGNSGYGGGIHNLDATVDIRNSTFSGNTSQSSGGGIRSAGYAASVSISNSTFTNNSADRGGGVDAVNAVLAMDNTIVAGNTANTNNDITTSGPAVGSHNLIGDGVGLIGLVNGVGGNQGNQVGTVTIGGVIDPLLGPLANNGGRTLTHALLAGSPAIDAGASTEPLDQRGAPFLRDDGNGVDIGAYERQTVVSLSLVVDTTADENDGDFSSGELSLREAIGLANGSIGPEPITFASPLFDSPQVIALTSQLPTITGDLTISGPGADFLTIDAGGGADTQVGNLDGYRIFSIDDGTATVRNATISGLRLTGGDVGGGGAIRNRENLDLSRVEIIGNASSFGGAIGHGGGLLTIDSSTIAENSSTNNGGGISSDGPLSISNTTISGNHSGDDGGGIISLGGLTLASSTLTGNTAVGSGPGMDVRYSDAQIDNTIVSGDIATRGVVNLTGDHNLFGGADPGVTGSNNHFVTPALLGPLANNGGPTQTHALLAGSPAIDAGASAEPFDQRGGPFFARDDGSGVDIGAYEAQSLALVVDTNTDIVDGDYTAGNLSLREAIGLSNANAGPDTITFDAAVFTGGAANEILLSGTELLITETLTIDASALAENVTIDAQQASRVLRFSDATGDLTLGSLNIQNGYTTGSTEDGAGVRFDSDGTLSLTDSTISDNTTTGDAADGGGIFTSYGSVTLTGSTVSGNTVNGFATEGGGIFTREGDVMLSGSTVSGNTSSNDGGGIYTGSGSVSLTSSIVSGNTILGNFLVSGDGGGIFAGGSATLIDSIVSGNDSRDRGGGIFAGGSATLTDSTVSGNDSGSRGGGIFAGSVMLTDSTVSGNTSGIDGGGIFAIGGDATLMGTTVSGNDGRRGGGIYSGSGDVMLSGSTLTGNSADDNGGAIYNRDGTTTISGSLIAGNTATGAGNEISNAFGTVSLDAYNLIGDSTQTTGEALNGVATGATDLLATSDGLNIALASILGPLAANGGPTQTHALMPGSPALDAANSAGTTDQRGLSLPVDLPGVPNAPGGNGSDIGAYEAQIAPSADFDSDGDVDLADLLRQQRGFGVSSGAVLADGNSDDDGDVDASDQAAWEAAFGQGALPVVAVSALTVETTLSDANLVDAAMALATRWQDSGNEEPLLIEDLLLPAELITDSSAGFSDEGSNAAAADDPETVELAKASEVLDPTVDDDPLGQAF